METANPRFRNDLVAQYLEEAGVQYVDVTDPNSGATFRFYDVEYSIACAMDGDRDLEGLVEWTRAELGIETTADELTSVVSTLQDLGYLDPDDAYYQPGGEGEFEGYPEAVDGDGDGQYAEGAEGDADGAYEGGAASAGEDMELGAPGAGDGRVAASKIEDDMPAPELELGAPGAGEVSRASSAGDFDHDSPTRGGKSRAEELELGAPGLAAAADLPPTAPAPSVELELGPPGAAFGDAPTAVAAEVKKPVVADEMSFAGLVDDTKVGAKALKKLEPPDADFTPPPAEVPTEAKLRPTTAKLDGEDEPTNLPKPMMEPDDDADVSVDLSAHLSLDRDQVQEAVRASKVMSVPELPPEMLEEERKQAAAEAVRKIEAELPPGAGDDDDEAKTRPAIPMSPVEPPRAVPATPLPQRPPPSMSKPIEPTTAPAASTKVGQKPKSGSSSFLLVILLLAAAGGGIYWYFFVRDQGTATPMPAPAQPKPGDKTSKTPPDKTPPDKTPPPAAAPAAKVDEIFGGAVEVKSPADGVIGFLAPAGKAVATDEPVLKLQGFQHWEAQKNQAAGRLNFYQGELDKAKAAVPPNQAGIDRNTKKVEEKQTLLTDAEKELANLVVLAPASGGIELVAKLGAPVKKGDVVVRIKSGGPQAIAVFEVGAGAADYATPGANCTVAQKGAPDKRAACVIDGVEGTKVKVRLVEEYAFKAGDEVELQPAKR